MSRATSMRVECPDCGRESSVTVWQSVNATLDPQLRETLLSGQALNVFMCEECNYVVVLDLPMLYHDNARAFAVQYLPAGMLEEAGLPSAYESRYPATLKDAPDELTPYLKCPHHVFDRHELRRSIRFFERLIPLAAKAARPAAPESPVAPTSLIPPVVVESSRGPGATGQT